MVSCRKNRTFTYGRIHIGGGMSLTEFLVALEKAGSALYLDDEGTLRVRGTIPEHLRPVIRGNKGHIVGYLKAVQETVALGNLVDSLPDGKRKRELFQQWEQVYERSVFLEGLDLYLLFNTEKTEVVLAGGRGTTAE